VLEFWESESFNAAPRKTLFFVLLLEFLLCALARPISPLVMSSALLEYISYANIYIKIDITSFSGNGFEGWKATTE